MAHDMALHSYRHVLRSIRIAFQGDMRVMSAARHEARTRFSQARSLEEGGSEAAAGVELAESVATLLRQNVVQGAREDEGDQFRLRIHGETERGDNDSVTQAGKFKGRVGGFAKCGS